MPYPWKLEQLPQLKWLNPNLRLVYFVELHVGLFDCRFLRLSFPLLHDLEKGLADDDPIECRCTVSAAIDVDMICTHWAGQELGRLLGGAAMKISSLTDRIEFRGGWTSPKTSLPAAFLFFFLRSRVLRSGDAVNIYQVWDCECPLRPFVIKGYTNKCDFT